MSSLRWVTVALAVGGGLACTPGDPGPCFDVAARQTQRLAPGTVCHPSEDALTGCGVFSCAEVDGCTIRCEPVLTCRCALEVVDFGRLECSPCGCEGVRCRRDEAVDPISCACRRRNLPRAGALGGACQGDRDCAFEDGSGLCLDRDAGAAGYCSKRCEDGRCPGGSTCAVLTDGSRACLAECSASAECRRGYACISGEAGSVCRFST